MRYLHHTLDPSDAAAGTVDDALGALAKAEDFARVLATVEDARLADLIDRIRARLGEQADIDVLGCSLVLLSQSHRLVARPRGFEVDPTRRAIWLVDELVASQPREERLRIAQELIDEAPTFSLQAQLLYRYRKRPADSASEPEIEVLETEAFDRLATRLVEQLTASPPADIAREQSLLFLLGLVHETSGQASVLKLLKQPPILSAVLEQTGTEVRPLGDFGVSLDIRPLVKIAGEDVIETLETLAKLPESLEPNIQAALGETLRAYRSAEENKNENNSATAANESADTPDA